MSSSPTSEYAPDYVSPPGDTLRELIHVRGMTQAELARRMGRPKKTVNEIVRHKAALTPETALQLERVLGAPAAFWNNRERRYREYLALEQERHRLQGCLVWLSGFPVKEMVKRGWIQGFKDDVRQVQELLGFFAVASPAQWEKKLKATQVALRKARAFKSAPSSLVAWLRQGELLEESIQCNAYDAKRFRASLDSIRGLTRLDPTEFQPRLEELCAASGVALVLVPQLPGTRASGAARWLRPKKALIQLSLRYKWEDQFWFSLFHEAAHILLHGKRQIFVDTATPEDQQDLEADTFAQNRLIPPRRLARFVREGAISRQGIVRFADEVGVCPGIVVGRLQHDGALGYSHCNELRRRFEWASATG
ncbi:MAG: ImmA/IrrE family metallo-endopeptidase [Candidatus Brocadiae bacterium]|nr:ImmA/IrrE family metallo-endopeptidase [Candidatus Brocadiia bacterium]